MSNVHSINLNHLVPSSRNVRRTNGAEGIEELAASIAAHGLLQNLTVRTVPVARAKKKGTVDYEVIAGGRRLAALKLLAKRKVIAKDTVIACRVLADETDVEISLAENATQCPMHPADQFEAFLTLHRDHGMSAEDIAARFGVTAAVVRQRLKLGAVSPKLMQLYRDGEMNLDQLTAFAITDDHALQESVWEGLGYDDSRDAILNALNEGNVPAHERRAVFVGLEAYKAAGGTIIRDLFDEEGGGFLADAALLNRLVREKLDAQADSVRAEGWKWVEVVPEFDGGLTADMRRVYPEPVILDDEDQAHLDELVAAQDEIAYQDDESEEASTEYRRLEAEIAALRPDEQYRPEDMTRAGVFVSLDFDGIPRIKRGFVRPEDAPPEAREASEETEEGKAIAPDAEKPAPGLSEKLVAELTATRTAALREAFAGRPEVALIAVVHALAGQVFFHGQCSALQISLRREYLSHHAPGIDESPTGHSVDARHESWAKRMPESEGGLWGFVAGLDEAERLTLLAHCAAFAINAVEAPRMTANRPAANLLARAVSLDMAASWQATAQNYFGRVSKERILEAVRDGVSAQAAKSLEGMKKQAMAEAAEKALAGTGWLPAPLRLPEA